MRRPPVPLIAPLSLVLALGYTAGCTFLVSFDSPPDGGATTSQVPDATTGANPDGRSGDASDVDSPSGQLDATVGDDDDEVVDAASSYPFPDAAHRPSESSPLPLQPDGCEPCKDYATKAFTCGTEHSGGQCDFGQSAIYECPGGFTADEMVIVGYECPFSEPCYPANGYAAVCDPCAQNTVEFVQQPVTTSQNNHSACIQCDAGVAVNILECTGMSCGCDSDTAFPDGG